MEELGLSAQPEPFYGVLALDGENLVPVPYIRRIEREYVFHEKSLDLGAQALAQITAWLRSIEEPLAGLSPPWLRTFKTDPALDEALSAMASDLTPVLPGFTNDANLFRQVHRYCALAPHATGRHILDLRAGSGYGLLQVAALARSVTAIAGSELSQTIAARAPWSFNAAETGHDLIVAFGLRAAEVRAVFEEAVRRGTPEAKIFLSAIDDEGREALAALGLQTRQLSMQPFPSNYSEWIGVFERASNAYAKPEPAPVQPIVSRRPLSVAFLLRPNAKFVFGGDVVQVQRTAEALRARGHRVEVLSEENADVSGFDVVNATGLTLAETQDQLRAIQPFAGPVVLMTIFADHAEEAVWGLWTHQSIFAMPRTAQGLQEQLRLFAQRRITNVKAQAPPARTEIVDGIRQAQLGTLELVDFMTCNAYSEVHAIKRHFKPDVPFEIVPSGVDAALYGPDRGAAFVQRYGLSDFVLMAGRFEERKNQVMFFEAVRKMDHPIVCIGKAYNPHYGALCSAFWPDNTIIFSELAEEEFAAALAAARVLVIPSWGEVVTLTSLNAAVSQCAIVLSRNGYEHEYLRDDAEYCDPADPGSIAAAIERAWQSYPYRSARRKVLGERIGATCTWERAAQVTEAVYYQLLDARKRKSAV